MNWKTALAFVSLALTSVGAALMDGATLIPGSNSTTLYGTNHTSVLKSWSRGGYSGYLTPQGTLLYHISSGWGMSRCPPATGYSGIGEADWDGNVLRTVEASNVGGGFHHAFNFTPEGHWLIIAAESVTYNNRTICSEKILEYDPSTQQVVWQWRAADHFTTDMSDVGKIHSSLLTSNDPLHFNSVDYDPVNNLIVASAHFLYEVLVIDRSTTTAEAATSTGGRFGKGGDILFRWGKPANYGITSATTYIREAVHGAAFVPPGHPGEGNILLFANQSPAFGNRSVAFEIEATRDGMTFRKRANGEFEHNIPFYFSGDSEYASTTHFGGVQRLYNGNTVVTFSQDNVAIELDNSNASSGGGNILNEWFFSGQVNHGILRYPLCYSGLSQSSVYDPTAPGCTTNAPTALSQRSSQPWPVPALRNPSPMRWDLQGRQRIHP